MLLDLHRQGPSVAAMAHWPRPQAVRKYIERGIELPTSPTGWAPNELVPYLDYLRDRVAACPDLSRAAARDSSAWLRRCLHRHEALRRGHPLALAEQLRRAECAFSKAVTLSRQRLACGPVDLVEQLSPRAADTA